MDFRAHILNTPLKRLDVPTPFWSKKDEEGNELVDGHIALQDVPSDEIGMLQTAYKGDSMKLIAAILCKSLLNKDTGQLIFSDADRDIVAKRGSSELFPLIQEVTTFFGLDGTAVLDAKKNLKETQSDTSGISFVKPAILVP